MSLNFSGHVHFHHLHFFILVTSTLEATVVKHKILDCKDVGNYLKRHASDSITSQLFVTKSASHSSNHSTIPHPMFLFSSHFSSWHACIISSFPLGCSSPLMRLAANSTLCLLKSSWFCNRPTMQLNLAEGEHYSTRGDKNTSSKEAILRFLTATIQMCLTPTWTMLLGTSHFFQKY